MGGRKWLGIHLFDNGRPDALVAIWEGVLRVWQDSEEISREEAKVADLMQRSGCERSELLEQGLVGWCVLDAGSANLGHEGRVQVEPQARCLLFGREEDCHLSW